MRMFTLASVLSCIAFTGPAQDQLPPLPGIGPHDPRVRVDPDVAPWRAVGKLQATSGRIHEACTGTLIGPALVLTAAHCVFNPQTRHNFLPSSLHFLTGYRGEDYAGHAIGIRLMTGPGYDPFHPQQSLGSDWALLTLDSPLGAPNRVLPLTHDPLVAGTRIMLGGYSLDHPLVLTADVNCRITGQAADGGGRPLLMENCAATRGDSGAPVLVTDGKGWTVAGVFIAASSGPRSGIVVPLTEMQAELARAGAVKR
jgi:protease YdgD